MMSTLGAALFLAPAVNARAQTYTVLYSFSGGADGGTPGPVIRDSATGTLYGVTGDGGAGGCQYPGCGTVFELTPTGTENVLHTFTNSPDGASPMDVLLDSEGNLFGTTGGGGVHGYGTVFRIKPNGTERVLYSFKGGVDGKEPTSGLIEDHTNGDFYGVTAAGGDYNRGVLYEIGADGSETLLYSFGASGTLGNTPQGSLVQDQNTGVLYGLLDDGVPCGGVFQLTPAGVESLLYGFTGQRGDGCQPSPGDPGLVMDTQGNLFGTTFFGGNSNQGVVFELTADGVEKVLYKFKGAKKGDGAWPYAGLVLDPNTGSLYGTTEVGGTGPCVSDKVHGCGTVFELSPPITKHGKWKETVLDSFAGEGDGLYPLAGITRDPLTGVLYGTARGDYQTYWGVVFKLTP